ncbi:cyclic nucleotide-binding protein [Elizabethkingia ursingii]|uniref:Crp/Fnr family transcriptional regulator n=1 Tax=Elizabethkingia ursingii TaxID=1756150 RepID=UPI000999D8B7|nr:Crp/Fnr family transcriptional regulator [Elizabethkingia ursingii]OPC01820.1 cyclic nucleotide-binding protein [Elizabethkingia ursingii]
MDKIIGQLIAHFKEIVPLDETDINAIIPKLEIKELDKKDYLIQPGQVSRHMRFIAKGSLHSYYTDEDGREHTAQLGIENWWINDLYSYLSESASRMYIQAVENTTLVQIHKNNLELLYKEVPKISEFWRLKMQGAYLILQERTFENMRFNAYTRYRTFVNSYPDIEQRFPQYMIASYLGITIEYLSTLRKKHIADRS